MKKKFFIKQINQKIEGDQNGHNAADICRELALSIAAFCKEGKRL